MTPGKVSDIGVGVVIPQFGSPAIWVPKGLKTAHGNRRKAILIGVRSIGAITVAVCPRYTKSWTEIAGKVCLIDRNMVPADAEVGIEEKAWRDDTCVSQSQLHGTGCIPSLRRR